LRNWRWEASTGLGARKNPRSKFSEKGFQVRQVSKEAFRQPFVNAQTSTEVFLRRFSEAHSCAEEVFRPFVPEISCLETENSGPVTSTRTRRNQPFVEPLRPAGRQPSRRRERTDAPCSALPRSDKREGRLQFGLYRSADGSTQVQLRFRGTIKLTMQLLQPAREIAEPPKTWQRPSAEPRRPQCKWGGSSAISRTCRSWRILVTLTARTHLSVTTRGGFVKSHTSQAAIRRRSPGLSGRKFLDWKPRVSAARLRRATSTLGSHLGGPPGLQGNMDLP
jgi:hypothetical protein